MALEDLLSDHVGPEVLSYPIDGTPLVDYLAALIVFLAALLILRIFKFVVLRRIKGWAKKTKNHYDDLVVRMVDKVGWLFYIFLSLHIAFGFVAAPDILETGAYDILLILAGYYIIKSIGYVIDFGANELIENRKEKGEKVDQGVINLLSTTSKAAMWAIVILLIASNLGYDTSALLTGLGIGGIAIALALQTVLSDVFAYFSIHIDKPFRLGDFIVVGADMGTVEKIGIKTTRIRTLQGQELVISNKELTESRINNFRRMENRRITFAFGIGQDTPVEKARKVPQMVKEIIGGMENARFDRAHFQKFGDFSLIYEVVYYMKTPDYNIFMDTQQEINLALKQRMEKAKIEMPFPTQTIQVLKRS